MMTQINMFTPRPNGRDWSFGQTDSFGI